MGVVYRVRDEETGLEVALKTLPTLTASQVYDLKREFRSLAGIGHPNLVALYELFVDERRCFFTMEYVDGVPFTERVAALRSGEGWRAAPNGIDAALDAARQLASGIIALHAAGKVHRDIKPNNVLVAPDDRVILLDFGLSFALDDFRATSESPELVGTPAYMAPEQMWGQEPAPAADWYAFGVVLYEAFAGRLPFEGGARGAWLDKQGASPPRLGAVATGIPDSVDRLVAALLAADPRDRPGSSEILARLSDATHDARRELRRAAAWTLADAGKRIFVGRESELARLRALHAQVRPGSAVIVHVRGPSGIGKTELVKYFATGLAGDPATLFLHGRCHPRESVPYKAIDAVVDGLGTTLLSLPADESRSLVPEHASALTRLFPVLERVPGFRGATPGDEPPEPFELRRRAVAALRDVLTGLCARHRVLLWIDDVQWADRDGASILRDVMRPPHPPGLFLLLSFRSEDSERLAELLADDGGLDAAFAIVPEVVDVGPLGDADSRELASATLARLGREPSRSAQAAIAAEADGSPFFIRELARALASSGGDAAATSLTPRLHQVLADRLAALGSRERALLEVIAVAGWPLVRGAALAAAAVGEVGRPLLSALEHASLIRETTVADQRAYEVYHDRIRESVIECLDADARRSRHRSIAETLRAMPDSDPHALFEHFLGAGERDLAREYALRAADGASAAFAFARAAALYRTALDLGISADARPGVLSQLGEALQGTGRGIEAAESFERAAAEIADRERDAERRLALLRRASEQFVRSGAIERGLRMLRSFLAEIDISLPRTPRGAMAASVWQRCRFLLRRTRVTPVAMPNVSSRDRLELESLWSAAASLTMVDPILGDAISVRGLLKAMDLGDRAYTIRGLGLEAAREAAFGGPFFGRRSRRLVESLESLARLGGEPYDIGWVHQSVGATAYLGGEWRTASKECGRAVALWRARCVGAAWEIVTAESFELSALAYQGMLASLARRLPDAIADGDRRDDVYASSGFRMGILNLLWLAEGRPLDARQINDEAVLRWPRERFLLQHFLHLVGAMQADLYLDEPERALDRIVAAWPSLRRAQLLALGSARIELLHLRARAALAVAASRGPGRVREPRDRKERSRADLLRVAARDARRLARESLPPAPMLAASIRAGLARLEGDLEGASRWLAAAADASEGAGMGLYGAAARIARGIAIGGDSGDELRAVGERWMGGQGVTDFAAMTAMLLPGTVPRG